MLTIRVFRRNKKSFPENEMTIPLVFFNRYAFGILKFRKYKISVKNGPNITSQLFAYSGSVSINPKSTFSSTDLCRDIEGLFIIVDSHASTVHLLNWLESAVTWLTYCRYGVKSYTCTINLDSTGKFSMNNHVTRRWNWKYSMHRYGQFRVGADRVW